MQQSSVEEIIVHFREFLPANSSAFNVLVPRRFLCKAFCEFRTVYENDYLRVPYNNQKIRNEPSLLNSYLLF